ncbi:MAG: Fe-S protein assembly chaperone HscA [Chitinophagales bacterium]|nr:Fe-S protein assembly chaperone HscA [Chitinophagales bacterium]MDW8427914.1 Fe-S protein assembly chaperone HscA [Chitinophagales bacterium]
MARIPIDIKSGSLASVAPNETIVGIDLGTTHSLIAYLDAQTRKPVCLAEHGQRTLVPSIVYFTDEGAIQVGDPARLHLIDAPERTIYSVKRLMGKSFREVQPLESYFGYRLSAQEGSELVRIRVGDRYYTPIELSAFILQELKSRAERILNRPVRKAVITVPAYFNDAQRQATRDAGKLAGLEVLRIINEPTAAALAYGLDKNPDDEIIAVYDLGGGTFDISLLRISNGIFEVLATHGDTFLGGDDFDRALVDFWLSRSADKQEYHNNRRLMQELRLKAEEVKIFLSSHEHYQGSFHGLDLTVSRADFEQETRHLIERTLHGVQLALRDAGLKPNQIHHVVLVGGATRMPMVKKAVTDFFGRLPHDQLNPDEVVALGAAIQADVLAGNQKDILLLDVTPLSLGIETLGELMDVLIPRNSRIPTAASRIYTTSRDGQTQLRISVYQGERDLVKDNRKLAEFILKNIPPMPAGLPKVEITFTLNADGILQVRARELRSGMEQAIEVKPQYGLTSEQIEQMLADSLAHAREDLAQRTLRETITEAQQLITSTEKFLVAAKDLLSEQEIQTITHMVKQLRSALDDSDADRIRILMQELNEYASPFAEQLMNQTLKAALEIKKTP